jgi:hypothetical protein
MQEFLNALPGVIAVIATMLITAILGYNIPLDPISQVVVVLGSIVFSVGGYWFGYGIIDRIDPDTFLYQVSFPKRIITILISVALAIFACKLYEEVLVITNTGIVIFLAMLNGACIGCAIGNFIRNLWDIRNDTWV